MSDSRVVLELIVFGARGLVGSQMFTSPQKISVGRDPRSMVQLDDASVSLRHAVVSLDGDSVTITDLGSRTGTWVNGKAITADQPLRPTDEVDIGAFRLRQTIHRAEASPKASAQPAAKPRPLAPPTPFEGFHPVSVRAQGLSAPAPAQSAPAPAPRSSQGDDEDEVTRVGAYASVAPPAMPPAQSPSRKAAVPKLDTESDFSRIDQLLNEVLLSDPAAEPAAPAPAKKPAPAQLRTETMPLLSPVPIRHERPTRIETPTGTKTEIRTDKRPQKAVEKTAVSASEKPAEKPVEKRAQKATEKTAVSATEKRSPKPEKSERAVRAEPQPEPASRAKEARTEKAVESRRARPDESHVTHEHEEEDDDEDDSGFVPPFDLLEVLSRGTAPLDTPASALAVEVARFRSDRVLWIKHIARGASLKVAESPVALGEYRKDSDGGFVLFPKACGSFSVRQDNRRLTPDEKDALARDGAIRVVPGMELVVDLEGGDGLMVHLVARAPKLAGQRLALRPILDQGMNGAFSLGVHLLVVVIVGLTMFGGKTSEAADVNAGRFAQIKIKEVEVEPPPPPPPPPDPVPTETVATQLPSPNQPPTPQNKRNPKAAQEKSTEEASQAPSDSAAKILKALGGAAAPGPDLGNLSNLDAVPHGASSGFKVSDAVGKAPGDTLRLGGGGGGDVATHSSAEIGTVGRIAVQSTGVVRARVTAPPSAAKIEGHLDRGEIQKVVNAHLSQVQGCYERQLVKNPSLSGKVSFRWVITPTGSVGSVKVAQSSIQSGEVISCIQSAIQGWNFPQPQGGSVTVTYPFAFTTFGN